MLWDRFRIITMLKRNPVYYVDREKICEWKNEMRNKEKYTKVWEIKRWEPSVLWHGNEQSVMVQSKLVKIVMISSVFGIADIFFWLIDFTEMLLEQSLTHWVWGNRNMGEEREGELFC